ncbi:hypothetical protein CH275_04370 [Rhodococcus sp. 06-235-1A]|nr:hypothetical protein CH275_04370 [Rhodococcus sp. 06-235-1A]
MGGVVEVGAVVGTLRVADGTEVIGVGRSVTIVAIGPLASPPEPQAADRPIITTSAAAHPILFIVDSFARGRRCRT